MKQLNIESAAVMGQVTAGNPVHGCARREVFAGFYFTFFKRKRVDIS